MCVCCNLCAMRPVLNNVILLSGAVLFSVSCLFYRAATMPHEKYYDLGRWEMHEYQAKQKKVQCQCNRAEQHNCSRKSTRRQYSISSYAFVLMLTYVSFLPFCCRPRVAAARVANSMMTMNRWCLMMRRPGHRSVKQRGPPESSRSSRRRWEG